MAWDIVWKKENKVLNKLHMKLALIISITTSIILILVLFVVAAIMGNNVTEDIRKELSNNTNAYINKISEDNIVSYKYLSQEELENHYIIAVIDNGRLLNYSGAYIVGINRENIINEAISNYGPSKYVYEIKSRGKDFYKSKELFLMRLSDDKSNIEIIVMKDLEEVNKKILIQRITISGIGLIGVISLWIIGFFVSSKSIEPIADNQRRQIEFIQAASHELRSPLAVVRANISAMVEDKNQVEHYAQVCENECGRMARLIDDLMLLASSGTGKWSFNESTVDIDTVLLNSYEKNISLCKDKGIELELNLPEDILHKITGDRERLEQVVNILIDNAISYSSTDRIEIKACEKKSKIYIYIVDFGIGISDEAKKYIFDRFYRSDDSRKDKQHFGLGLSIAKELITMHGGVIQVEDTRGGGATFAIQLNIN